jgi:hypothetical protein
LDLWGVYFTGAILGMALPALLYVTFLQAGTDIRGLGIAAALAQAVATQKGAIFGGAIAILGVWILFKAQLDILEGMTRGITDILWAGSARIRGWRGGDVRVVYYSVLAILSVWGIVALRLTQPIILLTLSANMAGIVFIISSLHLLYVNTHFIAGRVASADVATFSPRHPCVVLRVLFDLVVVEPGLKFSHKKHKKLKIGSTDFELFVLFVARGDRLTAGAGQT